MKRLFKLCILGLFSASNPASAQVAYTAPVEGSSFHTPDRAILIRSVHAVDSKKNVADAFVIIGSESGYHAFEVVENTAPEILLLQPNVPFTLGETVTVLQVKSLPFLNNFSLSFEISASDQKIPKTPDNEDFLPIKNNRAAVPANVVEINTNPTDQPVFFKNSGPVGSRYFGMLNNDGTGYISFQDDNKGKNFELQPSGYLSYYSDASSQFFIADSNFNEVDSFSTQGYLTDNHEFIHWPNGNYLVMAYDPQTVDMSVIVSGGDPNATVTGSIFQVFDAAHNMLFEWRSWDHFQITDSQINLQNSSIAYCHVNSIAVDDNGNYLLSSRNMDEITLVNGTSGNILWRMGGSQNQFTIVGDTVFTSRQHDAQFLAFGTGTTRFTTYDNGNTHPTPLSSAKEFIIDTVNMTATLAWRFDHPTGYSSQRTGSVQRLSNGNTFINWGYRGNDALLPNFTEVDVNDQIVWQFRFSDPAAYNVYRARRHAWDTLNVGMEEMQEPALLLFPNPASDRLFVKGNLPPNTSYTIVDVSGRLVQTDVFSTSIDISAFQKGLYFLTIQRESGHISLPFKKR